MGYLPTININGQQSYQSDVTKIPSIPGQDLNIPALSKNQYKIYGDVEAKLYDGGQIRQQKQMHDANAKVEQQSLEVELYKLKERINQLYFGILMLDGQIAQQDLLHEDLEIGLRKANASITGGTALKSSADILKAELLTTKQTRIELTATRAAYMDMLELMIGQPVDENTVLQKPPVVNPAGEVSRPELQLFNLQSREIDVARKQLNTQIAPKLSSFLQVGYGKPGLNMLNTEADSYYIAGFRMNWNLTGFYTRKKDRELLEIRRSTIDLQKETFLYNNDYQSRQQRAEITKLEQLAAADDEIIALRSQVKQTASVQLENGVIDSNDYLREVNEENKARQNKVIHEIQLLLAQYTLQTTTGI